MADAVKSAEAKYTKRTSTSQTDVRVSNITACKAVCDAIRTSLGPRGMDKMIVGSRNEVTITNDGATILKKMNITHPAAKMLVELSQAQDVEAGDGTTSVVVLAGSLLAQCEHLLERGIHPTTIAESFLKFGREATRILESMASPIDLKDRDALLDSAVTSFNSKVVSQYSGLLAPLAVDAVLRVIDPATATNVDLNDVKVVAKVGGTIDDTELVDGIVFTQKVSSSAGGPSRVENAKIALIQFQLSSPKTNIENQVVITDYAQMDRILREERKYILQMCKTIKKSGCNVLLIQKSILRDAVNDLALNFLAKMKILVVRDVERTEVEFICKTIGCRPIARPEAFSPEKLGTASLVEEENLGGSSRVVKVTGVPNPGRTVSVLVRGSNKLVVAEAKRSLHDALCVVRSLVKKRFMIAGGSAPEIEVAMQLEKLAKTLHGRESYCCSAFAEALEIVPYTLAENAGLPPIAIVTELRNRHAAGDKTAGINVRKGKITDILEEKVVQPLLVNTSAIQLATDTVAMILKIDDIVRAR